MAENIIELMYLNRNCHADECSFVIKSELFGETAVGWKSSDLNDASLDQLDNWRPSEGILFSLTKVV